jgi:hypothetical protein
VSISPPDPTAQLSLKGFNRPIDAYEVVSWDEQADEIVARGLFNPVLSENIILLGIRVVR